MRYPKVATPMSDILTGRFKVFFSRSTFAKPWNLLIYLFLMLYAFVIFLTFLDYGITYDEEWHSTYGEYIVQWYKSGFQDKRALNYWTLPMQGNFMGTIGRLASRLSPVGVFETSHLVNAVFGLTAAVGVYKLGRLLAGPLAGFLSSLFLVFTPRFYGHAFNNLVDIPMATFSIFTIYYLIKTIPFLPRPPKRLILKLGLSIGLALAARVGAFILVGYVGIAFFFWIASQYFLGTGTPYPKREFRISLLATLTTFLCVSIIAYFVMILWWPAAQVRPFVQPLKGLWYATHFGYKIDVFFDGTVISNTSVPWYYVSKWFLITLPEFYFMAMIAGLVVAGMSIFRFRLNLANLNNDWTLKILILLIVSFLPILYTAIAGSVEYDGVRHYLFTIPPMAVLAAVSLIKLFEKQFFKSFCVTIAFLILLSLTLSAVDMVQLHPHQYIFFNRIFGKGVAEASKSYETDYWGNSYKEGVEWIVRNYQTDEKSRKVKVASCLHSLSTSYFLPNDRFEYVGTFHDGQHISEYTKPDLFLATTRWNCHKKLGGKVIYTVKRKGIPLLYIIDVFNGTSDDKLKDLSL